MNKLVVNRVAILIGVIIIGLLIYKYASENVAQENPSADVQVASKVETAIDEATLEQRPMWLLFSSDSCYYCVEMYKVYEELKPEYQEEVEFIIIDVNDRINSNLVKEYKIRYIPTTFIIDSQGDISYEEVGLIPIEEIRAQLDKVVE